jgi:predicted amidohydrolase
MEPGGHFECYDKKYLFRMAGEGRYTPGTQKLIVRYKGWKIQPLICYDLRFPEWSRNTCNYDLLLYVANWPRMRIQAWQTLLQARAIENQAYVAGVNRIGHDGNDYPFNGFSSLISYDGSILYLCQDRESVFTTTISRTELYRFRAKLPFLADQDDFQQEDD